MRCLERNKVQFYYALYLQKQKVRKADEYGNELETGEYELVYDNPVSCKANISPATGMVAKELFGSLEGYDKIIVIDDPHTPINEYSILWIDTTPDICLEQNDAPCLEVTIGGVVIGDNGHFKPYDYIVKRVARSINSVAIAVSKVNVG